MEPKALLKFNRLKLKKMKEIEKSLIHEIMDREEFIETIKNNIRKKNKK